MSWLCRLPCLRAPNQRQAVGVLLILTLVIGEVCDANSIGMENCQTMVDFGQVSPQFSPYIFPLAAQFVVNVSDSPWFLTVTSDTHFRDAAGRSQMAAACLEWRRHELAESDGWVPFSGVEQIVAESAFPTGQGGEVIGIDYRLHVPWDLPPTGDAVTLAVQYMVGPTADLFASYVSPNPYNPQLDTGLEFGFYLPYDGAQTVTLKILSLAGDIVHEEFCQLEGEGWQSITWSGKTRQGFPIDPGQYSYQIAVNERVIGAGTLLVDVVSYGLGKIQGQVQDAETRKPLSLATVKVYNSRYRLVHTVKTDASGEFAAEWLAPDRYFVQVSCPGYFPETSDWFALGPGEIVARDFRLVHNNSLVVEELQTPERWLVGYPVESSFRIANPGTAKVLSAAAVLEVPGWAEVCADKVWIRRGTAHPWQAASEELCYDGCHWRLELGKLDPGESISVRFLAYARILSGNGRGEMRLWAEGITDTDSVVSAPAERNIFLDRGVFQPLQPKGRALLNGAVATRTGTWQAGGYLNYPNEVPLLAAERRYLSRVHGNAPISSSSLFGQTLTPMELGDTDKETAEGMGWVQYKEKLAIGVGERKLSHSPACSDSASTAGLHGLLVFNSVNLWASAGRPTAVERREEWQINRIIRDVVLAYEPLDPKQVLVYQENAQGERRVIDASQYVVSAPQKRITFFHPISPQDAFGELLVVEYQSAWHIEDGAQFLAVGVGADLGWHDFSLHILQRPDRLNRKALECQPPAQDGQATGKTSRWVTLEVEGEFPQRQFQYQMALSSITGPVAPHLDSSAVQLNASWLPTETVSVQMESILAGKEYRAFSSDKVGQVRSSEASLDWLLPGDVALRTKAGAAWREGSKEFELTKSSEISWSPENLPTISLVLEEKSADSDRVRTLVGKLNGETKDLTWRLWGGFGKEKATEDSSVSTEIGFDCNYRLGAWSSIGLAYSRSGVKPRSTCNNAQADQDLTQSAENSQTENSLEMRFQTAPFSPVCFYSRSALEWTGSLVHGWKALRTNMPLSPECNTRKIFDLGMTADLGNGLAWDVSVGREFSNDGVSSASSADLCIMWEEPRRKEWHGQVKSSWAWGDWLADTVLLEREFSLPLNLGVEGWSERREWMARAEYTDLADHSSPQIDAYCAFGDYRGEDLPTKVSLIGAELVLPWNEKTDVFWKLDCQVAEKTTVRILTRELTGGVLRRLNERWSLRGELSCCRQSPNGDNLASLGFGAFYQVAASFTVGGGLSYLWNGKTNYEKDNLQPYLQLYCGAVPFDLLD